MSRATVTARGRRFHLAGMTSRIDVRRLTGRKVTDPAGFKVPEWATPATDVPFQLVAGRGPQASRRTTVGGDEVESATPVGKVPVGTVLRDGDLLSVTRGEHTGRVFRVVESTGADHQTSLRVPVVEVARPEEW